MTRADESKRWLAVRISAMGDVVLTTGVLKHLSETLGWNFTFLTKAPLAPILAGHPAINNVVVPDEDQLHGKPWREFCRELADEYHDHGLLDLHGSLRSRLLARAWKGPVRRYPKFSISRRVYAATGLGWAGRRLEKFNVPQRYAMAALPHAPAPALIRPVIHISDDETARARDLMARAGLAPDRPAIALHPYATHPNKMWPREYWLELARLLQNSGRQWLALGKNPAPFLGGPTDLTNATNLRTTCAVLAQCAALVTNDSGPMHLGTAVGTPVKAVFGPTSKAWGFFPSGPEDIVLQAPLPCRPCSLHGGSACSRDLACMKAVTPQDVLANLG